MGLALRTATHFARSLREKKKQTPVFKNYAFRYFRPLHLHWFLWLPQVGSVSSPVVCCGCGRPCWLPRFGGLCGRGRCVLPVGVPCCRCFQCCVWSVGAWPRCICGSFCGLCSWRCQWRRLVGFVS